MAERGGITDGEFVLTYLRQKYAHEINNPQVGMEGTLDEGDSTKTMFSIVYIVPKKNEFLPDVSMTNNFGSFLSARLKEVFASQNVSLTQPEIKTPTQGIGVECIQLHGNATIMKQCIKDKDPNLYEEVEQILNARTKS